MIDALDVDFFRVLNTKLIMKDVKVYLQALLTLLKKKPYIDIRVKNILKEADSSKGKFYYYFKDKDELLTKLLDHQFSEISKLKADILNLNPNIHPMDFIKRLILSPASIESYCTRCDLMFRCSCVMKSEILIELIKKDRERRIGTGIEMILFFKQQSTVRQDADAHQISELLFNSIFAINCMNALAIDKRELLRTIENNIEFIFNQFLKKKSAV